MKWIDPQTTTPPEEELTVMDENGNIAQATPCYYPFTTKRRSNRRGDFEVIPCDPYWDGTWLVRCFGLDNPLTGRITHYSLTTPKQD